MHPPQSSPKAQYCTIPNWWTWYVNCSLWISHVMYKDFPATQVTDVETLIPRDVVPMVDWNNRIAAHIIKQYRIAAHMMNRNEFSGWHSQFSPCLVELKRRCKCSFCLWAWTLKYSLCPLIKPTSGPDDLGLVKRVWAYLSRGQIFATLMRVSENGRLYYC